MPKSEACTERAKLQIQGSSKSNVKRNQAGRNVADQMALGRAERAKQFRAALKDLAREAEEVAEEERRQAVEQEDIPPGVGEAERLQQILDGLAEDVGIVAEKEARWAVEQDPLPGDNGESSEGFAVSPATSEEFMIQPSAPPSQPPPYSVQPSAPSQPPPYSAQPSGRPNQPPRYPGQPGARPSQTTRYPGQPGARPSQPTRYPGQPSARPSQPPQYPRQGARRREPEFLTDREMLEQTPFRRKQEQKRRDRENVQKYRKDRTKHFQQENKIRDLLREDEPIREDDDPTTQEPSGWQNDWPILSFILTPFIVVWNFIYFLLFAPPRYSRRAYHNRGEVRGRRANWDFDRVMYDNGRQSFHHLYH